MSPALVLPHPPTCGGRDAAPSNRTTGVALAPRGHALGGPGLTGCRAVSDDPAPSARPERPFEHLDPSPDHHFGNLRPPRTWDSLRRTGLSANPPASSGLQGSIGVPNN